MTIDELFLIPSLHAVWAALGEEMQLCFCPDMHGYDLCLRCECLSAIAEAARMWAAQLWHGGPPDA